MSDRWAASISIGGRVPLAVARDLLDVITEEGVSLDYGEMAWAPQEVDDLMEKSEGGSLTLCNDEAKWGEFRDLEIFLTNNKIAFDRSSSGYYEYAPEIVQYRPEMGAPSWITDTEGRKLVDRDSVKNAIGLIGPYPSVSANSPESAFVKAMDEALGPDVEDLKPFEIVPRLRTTRRRNAEHGD